MSNEFMEQYKQDPARFIEMLRDMEALNQLCARARAFIEANRMPESGDLDMSWGDLLKILEAPGTSLAEAVDSGSKAVEQMPEARNFSLAACFVALGALASKGNPSSEKHNDLHGALAVAVKLHSTTLEGTKK